MKVTAILLFNALPRSTASSSTASSSTKTGLTKSSSSSGSEAVVLGSAMDLRHFSFFERSTAREFILFACRTIATNAPIGQRHSVTEREYIIFAINIDGMCACVVADQAYPKPSGFAVARKAIEQYGEREGGAWQGAAVDCKKALPFLDQLLAAAQEPTSFDHLAKVQSEINDTRAAIETTLRGMLNRGDRLEDLMAMSNDLTAQTKMFAKQSKDLNTCCVVQ